MTTLDQLVEAGARAAWKPISEAPYNTPVRVKVGNMTLIARLMPDASVSSLETSCDQWQAEYEGEHPPCWSGGACWESNENETESLQPTAWQPLDSECTAILAILPLLADDLAGVIQRRMDERFAEYGTTESDTNASYYSGRAGELYESLDEEDEEIAQDIRASIAKLMENENERS